MGPEVGRFECFVTPHAQRERGKVIGRGVHIQWNLTNPNSLGPAPVRISEIFGLVQ